MSATDELCAMLADRCEEFFMNDFGVNWRYYSDPHTATESMDGTLIVTGLTPEQAIAATLGDADATRERHGGAGTCKADETDVIKCWVKCKYEPSTEHVELIHVMECSACGGTYEHVNGSYEFCPRCGRRIEVDG